jgi:hypothetical protein
MFVAAVVHGAACTMPCADGQLVRQAECQANGTWLFSQNQCEGANDDAGERGGSSSSSALVVAVGGGAAVLLVAVLAGVLVLCLRARRQSQVTQELELEMQALVPQKVGQQLMLAYGHLFGASTLEAEEARFAALEVARRTVQLERLIGEGQSGSVFLGQLRMQGLRRAVAVKMGVAGGSAPSQGREEALQMEARLLHLLQHPHIVSVLAVVTRTLPTLLCLEYMVNGDLKTYLR